MMPKTAKQKANKEIRTVSASAGQLTYLLSRKAVKNVNLRIDREGYIRVSASPRVPVSFIDDFVREKEGFIRQAIESIQRRQKASQEAEEARWEEGSRVFVLGQPLVLFFQEGRKEGICADAPYLFITLKPDVMAKWIKGDRKEAREHIEAIWQQWQRKLAKDVLEDSMERMGRLVAPYGIFCREMSIRRMTSRWGSCQPVKGKITLNTRLVEAHPKAIDYVVLHELAHMKYPHHQKSFYDFIALFMPDWKERREMLKGII